MFHWLHHLLNPHCPLCDERAIEGKVCQSCETLKMQLSIANHEKQQMLNSILSLTKPPEIETSPKIDYERAKPSMVTWRVRKQMLEAEDRERAKLLAERKRHEEKLKESPLTPGEANYVKETIDSIEKLEEELGLETEVKADA